MDTSFLALFLDLLVLALIFFPIVNGARNGLAKRLLSIGALIISAIAGYMGSAALTPSVYDEYLSEHVHAVCLRKAEQYDPVRLSSEALAQYGVEVSEEQIRDVIERSGDAVQYAETLAQEVDIDQEQLNEFASQLSNELLSSAPETVRAAVPEVLNDAVGGKVSAPEAFEMIRAAAESPEAAANYAEKHYAKPIITGVLRVALFAAIMVLVRLLLTAIIAVAASALGSSSTADRIQGGLVGAAQGLLEVGLLLMMVRTAETVSDGRFDPQRLGSFIFLPIYNLFFH